MLEPTEHQSGWRGRGFVTDKASFLRQTTSDQSGLGVELEEGCGEVSGTSEPCLTQWLSVRKCALTVNGRSPAENSTNHTSTSAHQRVSGCPVFS